MPPPPKPPMRMGATAETAHAHRSAAEAAAAHPHPAAAEASAAHAHSAATASAAASKPRLCVGCDGKGERRREQDRT